MYVFIYLFILLSFSLSFNLFPLHELGVCIFCLNFNNLMKLFRLMGKPQSAAQQLEVHLTKSVTKGYGVASFLLLVGLIFCSNWASSTKIFTCSITPPVFENLDLVLACVDHSECSQRCLPSNIEGLSLCNNDAALECRTAADCDFGKCSSAEHGWAVFFGYIVGVLFLVVSCLALYGVKRNWVDPAEGFDANRQDGAATDYRQLDADENVL